VCAELDHRIESLAGSMAEHGESIRYLGSILIVDDEVVLCLFEGSLATVRSVADQAGAPFGRILQSIRTPLSM
jgi:hypothetical protein